MTFKINEFISVLNKRKGLASSSHYMVLIPQPEWNRGDSSAIPYDLRFLCSSVNMPGIALATSDIRHYGYGLTEKRPYAPIFGDVEMTFLSTSDGKIKSFFDSWMVNITNYSLHNGISGGVNGAPFFMNYPKRYVVDITIYTYDRKTDDVNIVTLLDAYPIKINDINYGYENLNSIVQLPINFTYRTWNSGALPTTKIKEYEGNTSKELMNRLMETAAGIGKGETFYNNYIETTLNEFNNDL